MSKKIAGTIVIVLLIIWLLSHLWSALLFCGAFTAGYICRKWTS